MARTPILRGLQNFCKAGDVAARGNGCNNRDKGVDLSCAGSVRVGVGDGQREADSGRRGQQERNLNGKPCGIGSIGLYSSVHGVR